MAENKIKNIFEEQKGFSFRKELSNMFNVVKDATLPNIFGISYNITSNEDLLEKTNYNQIYLKAIVQPMTDLINAGKLNKYSGRNQ